MAVVSLRLPSFGGDNHLVYIPLKPLHQLLQADIAGSYAQGGEIAPWSTW